MANRIQKSQSAGGSTKSRIIRSDDTRTPTPGGPPGNIPGTETDTGPGAGSGAETDSKKVSPSASTGESKTPNLVIPRKAVSDVAEKYLSETDNTLDEAFTVDQTPMVQPDSNAVKDAIYGVTGTGRKMAKKEAVQTAVILLALLDGIGTIAFGKNAGMLDYEKDMIKEPLERILQRMDITSSAALAKWSDPIMLFMGLSAWITRVAREKKESQAIPESQSTVKHVPGKPAKNGQKEKEVYLVESLHTPQYFTEGLQGKPNEF